MTIATAVAIVAMTTARIYDTDVWQHLLVGRAIWTLHAVPRTQLWSWPTYGAPDVNYAWGFETVLWPVYAAAGVAGLFAWRWATTLAAFAACAAAARRMGARGLAVAVAMVLCALAYQTRAHVRPETLVAVLLAVTLWILETRRHGGPDRAWWIVAVAWGWANVHISWPFAFALLAVYAIDDAWPSPGVPARPRRSPLALARVGAVALGAMLVNPFGARALAQPFAYLLVWRHERLYAHIVELMPPQWSDNLTNLLPLLVAGWPVLLLWRARRAGWDRVELLLCMGFSALALRGMRFMGPYAIVAAPFVARDLDAWVRARRWPAWTAPPARRAALVIALEAAMVVPLAFRTMPPLGFGFLDHRYPAVALDFVDRAGVRGRTFNVFEHGGYLLWRFWPDSTRLPFMDIHQSGTPQDRELAGRAFEDAEGWRALDRAHGFDWALVPAPPRPGSQIADALDADSSWALAFTDDVALVYVRRTGPMAALAARAGYRALHGGRAGRDALSAAAATDPALRAQAEGELAGAIAGSPERANALGQLAVLEALDGRTDLARGHLEQALEVDPTLAFAHEDLARLALFEGRAADAIPHLLAEWRHAREARVALALGAAYHATGDVARARAWFARAATRAPGDGAAAESLRTLDVR